MKLMQKKQTLCEGATTFYYTNEKKLLHNLFPLSLCLVLFTSSKQILHLLSQTMQYTITHSKLRQRLDEPAETENPEN